MADVLSNVAATWAAFPTTASPRADISIQPDTQSVKLKGTGSDIEGVKLLRPCYADTPLEQIRKQYEEDGVVWVKGLLPRDLVLETRRKYLEFVNQGSGMLKPGTDPADGIFSGADWRDFLLPGAIRRAIGLQDTGKFVENAIRSHKTPFYLDFKEKVADILEPFVGRLCDFAEPWCLPRSLLRCAVPGGDSTPVHYDQIYLRAGPPTSITAWVPIGDVEIKGGGLIYLERAHDLGMQYEKEFSERNAVLSDEERISAFNRNMEKGGWLDGNASRFGERWSRAWLVGEYEAGDVVFHTPYSIHAGATNESPEGRIRVATDLRFVDKTKPYDQRWTVLAYDDHDPNVARSETYKS